MKNVIAIVGSPRVNGNTGYLVDRALEAIASRGIGTEKIMLCDYKINPCLGHDACASFKGCAQKDDMPAILDRFAKADGLILGSPVYYYDMTAQMKAFVDRNYFLYTHNMTINATCAGIIAVGGGDGIDLAVGSMMRYLKSTKDIPDSRIITVSGTAGQAGAVKNNTALVAAARKMGEKIAEMLSSAR